MNASTTAPLTVQIGRGRLFALIVGVAAVAAAITWAVTSGVNSGRSQATPIAPASTGVLSMPIPPTGYLNAVKTRSLADLTPRERQYVTSLIALTPAELKATFGTGHADPIAALGLTPEDAQSVRAITSLTPAQLVAGFGTDAPTAAVLASLTPKERRYVESILALTPGQLKAGAAGATGK